MKDASMYFVLLFFVFLVSMLVLLFLVIKLRNPYYRNRKYFFLFILPWTMVNIASLITLEYTKSELSFHIAFTSSEKIQEFSNENYVFLKKLSSYESQFSEYKSAYFYKYLSEEERVIYNLINYAVEKGDSYVCVPTTLMNDVEFNKIATFVACDNPLIEMNMPILKDENDGVFISCFPFPGKIIYNQIYLTGSDEDSFQKKKQAIEVATNIVSNMPIFQSDMEKAYYLYDIIIQSVEYREYDQQENTEPDYLYDALIEQKSNCDGISKAIALLFNMSGIECINIVQKDAMRGLFNAFSDNELIIEALFSDLNTLELKEAYQYLSIDEICKKLQDDLALLPEVNVNLQETGLYNSETDTYKVDGHTWNYANLDGRYYIFDATNDLVKNGEVIVGFPFYFALSTKEYNHLSDLVLQEYLPYCEKLADDNFLFVYCVNLSDDQYVAKIIDSYQKKLMIEKEHFNIKVNSVANEDQINSLGLKLQEKLNLNLHYSYCISTDTTYIQFYPD